MDNSPEVKRMNQILVGKIVNIFNKTKNTKKEEPFRFPEKGHEKQRQLKRIIEQDNKYLHKKVQAAKATGFYSNKKLRDDFNRNLGYVKNICEFPPIDFEKPISITNSPLNKDNTIYGAKNRNNSSPNTIGNSKKLNNIIAKSKYIEY